MKIRKLTADDVEFTLEVEPECDIPLEGNCIATDDDEADRKYTAELQGRLDRDDVSAWCVLIVKARWNGHEGVDTLGGVTLSEAAGDNPVKCEEEAQEMADLHGMEENALAALNAELAEEAGKLSQLET